MHKKNVNVRIFSVIWILIFLLAQHGFCTDFKSALKHDAKHVVYTGFKLVQAPFQFDGNDWKNVGLAVGSTALLFMADKSIQNIALSNQSDLNDKLFWEPCQLQLLPD